jgi:hypothetical protein
MAIPAELIMATVHSLSGLLNGVQGTGRWGSVSRSIQDLAIRAVARPQNWYELTSFSIALLQAVIPGPYRL